jgi:hypothetical protein
MSGWDGALDGPGTPPATADRRRAEGQVFFSDQAAAFHEGEEAGLSAPVARRKFAHFLNNFRSEPTPGRADGETLYKDRLDAMRPSGGLPAEHQAEPVTLTLTVQLEDLIAHDPDLADRLKQKPAEYTALVCARPGGFGGKRATRAAHSPACWHSWRWPARTCSCRFAPRRWRTQSCRGRPSRRSWPARSCRRPFAHSRCVRAAPATRARGLAPVLRSRVGSRLSTSPSWSACRASSLPPHAARPVSPLPPSRALR